MINRFAPILVKIRYKYPRLYDKIVRFVKKYLGKRLGIYPHILENEVKNVTKVLYSSQWNMAYGKSLIHEKLEEKFAEYVGVPHAIAVTSGGVALQMSMRVLGLKPGDEVIHQVDTCSATAMAVMNAGITPIFADISEQTFMLSNESINSNYSSATKALLATHMWGNPEQMSKLRRLADSKNIKLIEDACLSLGTIAQGKKAGSWGDVGVFSFGCIKPIQGGEGGMIVTSDIGIARELKSMRHWGDRTLEFGERDTTQLSWNGRMSEIVAAVVLGQLGGYPKHLSLVREAVEDFGLFIKRFPEISINLGATELVSEASYTQVVLRINSTCGISKQLFWDNLKENGISVWHANFELINSLSFFKKGTWKNWILKGDIEKVKKNYSSEFPIAKLVFDQSGIGLGKMNFLSKGNLHYLKRCIEISLKKSKI